MAKKIVKNASNLSLYLNLPEGRSLKIRARDAAEVDEADLQCAEMLFHLSRGNVVVLEKPEAPRPEEVKPKKEGGK